MAEQNSILCEFNIDFASYKYIFNREEHGKVFFNHLYIILRYMNQRYKELIVDFMLDYIVDMIDFLQKVMVSLNLGKELLFDEKRNVVENFADTYGIPLLPIPPKEFVLSIVGPIQWKFLHLTSMVVYGNSNLVDMYKNLLMNYNFLMFCSECIMNYTRKDYFRVIYFPMNQTKDSITPLYNFHNLVNIATFKKLFSFEEFKNLYELKAEPAERVRFIGKINIPLETYKFRRISQFVRNFDDIDSTLNKDSIQTFYKSKDKKATDIIRTASNSNPATFISSPNNVRSEDTSKRKRSHSPTSQPNT